MNREKLKDVLARNLHYVLHSWIDDVVRKCDKSRLTELGLIIPKTLVHKWNHQIHTSYESLSEEEKAFSISQAESMLKLIDREMKEETLDKKTSSNLGCLQIKIYSLEGRYLSMRAQAGLEIFLKERFKSGTIHLFDTTD